MKKLLIIILFICLYLLVGFFGLGPVLLADGTMQERLTTLGIVILIFAVMTYVLVMLLRYLNKK